MNKNIIIVALVITTITSLVINIYLNNRLKDWESISLDEIKNNIHQKYIDDLKMLSYQIVNSKNHADTLANNFSIVNSNFLMEVKPKGKYEWIQLNNISLSFDSLGYVNKIYLINDSIIKNK